MVSRYRVVLTGQFPSPSNEVWSVGFHYAPTDATPLLLPAEIQAWAVAAATYLGGAESTTASVSSQMGTGVTVNRLDIYGYPDTGPATVQGSASLDYSGTGTVRMPQQCAMGVSLRTAFAGASRRGRFYWPCLAATLGTGGKMAVASNTAVQFANILEGIGDAGGAAAMRPVVYSPTLDLLTPVTSVRVGDVIDTQRRRRDTLVESYQSTVYPA